MSQPDDDAARARAPGWLSRIRRLLRAAAVALAAGLLLCGALYLCRAPLGRWIGGHLVRTDPPAAADAIVVLSGGVPEREIEAADLYRAGYAPLVVLTREAERPGLLVLRSRGVGAETGLEFRLRILRELGVPAAAVRVLDGLADSTSTETGLIRAWVHGSAARRLIIVTSPFHTGRARYVFRRALAGETVELRFRAASFEEFAPDGWWRNRITLTRGLIEWQKLIVYRIVY